MPRVKKCIISVLFCIASALSLHSQISENDILVFPIPGISKASIRGVDISMLAQVEELGGQYFDFDGKAKDLFDILKANGVNWVRLRLWNNPINDQVVLEGDKIISNKGQRAGGGNNDLERTLVLAKRAKAKGFQILLDFHYSDFWADPGKQTKPAAWKNLKGKALEKALFDYTKTTLSRFITAGARPDMVQIGNELNNGMLWPDGKVWAGKPDEIIGGMSGFIGLLKQASAAVRAADTNKKLKPIKIAIHLADGGRNELYRSVFDAVTEAKIDYDIIGLSFYPYWHGGIEDLSANLFDIGKRYKKELVIMETAYAHTLADGDGWPNVFQVFDGPTGGYLASVQGQATVYRDVLASVLGSPYGLGAFYWEPAWLPITGAGWRTGEGNAWENQAMFDFSGKALASLRVFSRVLEQGLEGGPVPIRTEAVTIEIVKGSQIILPQRVKTIYSDDSWRYAEVVWDDTEKGLGHLLDSGLPAKAIISYTSKRNELLDPSFESGTLNEWLLDDTLAASKAEKNSSNAHTGSWTYKYWLAKPFVSTLSKTFTGLTPGKYTFSVWSMGGGGENSLTLFAQTANEKKTKPMRNMGWKTWNQYVLTDIEVTDGSVSLGITIDAQAGNWGNFDDFEFYLVRD